MTIVVGIIGPPCSGKSAVAGELARRGGEWLNADAIAKEQLTAPEVITALVGRLGKAILEIGGEISRPNLADRVFGGDVDAVANLRFLESVVHPRVRHRIAERLRTLMDADHPLAILDVPLLIESGWDLVCDEVWCVDVPPQRHSAMIAARGWDAAELARRTAHQLPRETKLARSTAVIVNSAGLAELKTTIAKRADPWPTNLRTPQHCRGTSDGRPQS